LLYKSNKTYLNNGKTASLRKTEDKPMECQFSRAYPNIAHWVNTQGWIEIGPDEYSSSSVRALDEGGLIRESSDDHTTVDEALQALEKGLAAWLEEYG